MVFSGFLHKKTDRHYITELLLKVALSTINLTLKFYLKVRQPNNINKKRTEIKKKYLPHGFRPDIFDVSFEGLNIIITDHPPGLVPGEMYSIQHYGITFVSDLRQVGGFLYQ